MTFPDCMTSTWPACYPRLEAASNAVRRATENLVKAAQESIKARLYILPEKNEKREKWGKLKKKLWKKKYKKGKMK